MSADQYAVTLGTGFGITETNLDPLFSNLPHFASSACLRNLGFMNAA